MAGIWPGDTRCVALLTFDVDGPSAAIYRVPDALKKPSLISMGEYGPKIAVPRILDLLSNYKIKATFFIPGWIAENNSGMVRRILDEGHEVGHHGYMHEPPAELTPEKEIEALEKGISAIEGITGERTRGYRSPAWELSERTLDNLFGYGFVYDSSLMGDDAPYYVDASGGPMVELPIHWLLDDAAYFSYSPSRGKSSPMKSPAEVFDCWKAEFDGLYHYGRTFHLTMHPHVIGRPGRLLMLEQLIQYIRSHSHVKFMRCIDLAEQWRKHNQLDALEASC